jgi:hypothetical protein
MKVQLERAILIIYVSKFNILVNTLIQTTLIIA